MLNRFSIKTRLFILMAFAILNVCQIGVVGSYYLDKTVKTYNHVVDSNLTIIRALGNARSAQQRALIIITSSLAANEDSSGSKDKVNSSFEKAIEDYDAATHIYEEIPPAEGEAALRQSVEKSWEKFIEVAQKLVKLSGSNRLEDLNLRTVLIDKELPIVRKSFKDSFDTLAQFHDSESKKWAARAEEGSDFAKKILYISILFGCFFQSLTGFQNMTSISQALRSISEKISEASRSTGEASQRISDSIEQITISSTQQASSLQETAASMEEIHAMVAKNAENAKHTQSISMDSQKQAAEGKKVVHEVVNSMDHIRESNNSIGKQIESSNKEMGEIVKLMGEIENKTKVINDIVFQTKLLSFNASVEAARAGEHGKGFAVVAEEVGNLAQMSGDAAQSISAILQTSSRRVSEIIEKSNSGINSVLSENTANLQAGSATAVQCRAVLENLVENVNQVNSMASDIASASDEQAQGVKEVNSALTQLEGVAQKTSTSSQTLSSASDSLIHETDLLNTVVKELFELVSGKKYKDAA